MIEMAVFLISILLWVLTKTQLFLHLLVPKNVIYYTFWN